MPYNSHHCKVDTITGLVLVKTVIFHFLIGILLLDHGKVFVWFSPEAMFNAHGYQRSQQQIPVHLHPPGAYADAFQVHLHFEAKPIFLSFLPPSPFPCPFSFTLPFLYPFAFPLPLAYPLSSLPQWIF